MDKAWGKAVAVYTNRPVLIMFFLGFSAGIPILLVFSSLSIWLREAGVNKSTIGFFSWVALPYTFKFLWAPLVDKVQLPLLDGMLGRRRSWLLLSQIMVIISIIGMAMTDAAIDPGTIALFAIALAFSSATQDIVVDGYRIEAAAQENQGAMASTYQAGYRLAMILAGAGVLEIAGFIAIPDIYSYSAWKIAYLCMAAAMLVGVVTTFVIAEPENTGTSRTPLADLLAQKTEPVDMAEKIYLWFKIYLLDQFLDFFQRYGKMALAILALVAVYRISDVVLGVMAGPFYIDLGFTKSEIGRVSKLYGVLMTLGGAFIGGALIVRYGLMPILMLGGILSAATNLLFAWMSGQEALVPLLVAVISADNLSAGIATVAFIAYLSSLTSQAHTATQYALFSSIMLLFPKFIGGFSGVMVDNLGYSPFFIITALMGVPVVLLIWLVRNHGDPT